MSKLTKKQQAETDILAKRMMPKTDFLKVVEHDKLYYNTLNEALEYNIIKQDILGKKCQNILATQTKENISKNISILSEYAETKLKVLDFKGKLHIHRKLIDDKELHYENVFLPQFNKESKEAQENLSKTMQRAVECSLSKDEKMASIVSKISYELEWWSKCDAKQKKNEEYIVQVYKPLKRLLSAWDKKVEELKENEKYM
tara:strand:+ start:264 stop:866 length:603 start_codon:yes stop_codon:yes gene_type:complete